MAEPGHRSTFSRFIGPFALFAGLAGIVLALTITNHGDDTDTTLLPHPAIEALIPSRGSEVLRQTRVGIDLEAGYEAELAINGIAIPPDQLNVLRGVDGAGVDNEVADLAVSRFLYQPLEGRIIGELPGDENCVVARFWPLADPNDVATVEWCFNVA